MGNGVTAGLTKFTLVMQLIPGCIPWFEFSESIVEVKYIIVRM